MHHNRKGIPKEVKALNDREERSVLYVYHTRRNISCWSPTSTRKRKKPQVHTMYDHKKGGVDVVDSLSKSHSTWIKSKRWHLNALAFIPNTCRSNAKTILGDKSIKSTNSHSTYNLGKALVLPSIEKRYRDLNGLQIRIINKMQRVHGIKEVSRKPEVENAQTKSGRCFKCVEGIAGTSTYMIERENLNNKLKFKCRKCNNFIWKKHQHQIEYICED